MKKLNPRRSQIIKAYASRIALFSLLPLAACTPRLLSQPFDISPTSGPIGTLITVTGSETDPSTIQSVTVGGVLALPINSSSSSATFLVMPGSASGSVLITPASGNVIETTSNFNVTASEFPQNQEGSKLVGAGIVGGYSNQGNSVGLSADGNTLITGGWGDNSTAGASWIYVRNGGIWSQQAKLVGLGTTNPAAQGWSVSISADGNTVIVGGYSDNFNKGAAWIFVRNNGFWTQQAKLVGTGMIGSFALQGYSVSMSADGNTALVGASFDSSGLGASWVFTRTEGVWSQQAKLVGASAVGYSKQGESVSLSADGCTALIGGPSDSSNVGAGWIFTRTAGVWNQEAKLVGTGAIGSAGQGSSVSLSADGNTALIGGTADNSNTGASWVFTRSVGVWNQEAKLVGTGAIGSADQGGSVSLSADGNTALIGGPGDNSYTGASWLFTRSVGVWNQEAKLTGTGANGNAFQGYVSLSADGTTAAMGGPKDNSSLYYGATWIFGP